MRTLVRSMMLNEQLQFKKFVTRAERLRTLVKTMTTTEQSKFGEFVFRTKKKRQEKTPIVPLSRETSPHTNQMFTAVPPSRETNPHTSQALEKLMMKPEQCEECGREHPTCICIKRSQRLCNLKEAANRPMQQKTVTFDISEDESSGSDTLCNSEESDDKDSAETQRPTSQNDEIDAQLVHTAWLRKTLDNVYMSNQKSMSLRAYIHAAHQRTEAATLLDSGATENFMNLTYAKWLKLPFKRLSQE